MRPGGGKGGSRTLSLLLLLLAAAADDDDDGGAAAAAAAGKVRPLRGCTCVLDRLCGACVRARATSNTGTLVYACVRAYACVHVCALPSARVRACVRACVRAYVHVCAWVGQQAQTSGGRPLPHNMQEQQLTHEPRPVEEVIAENAFLRRVPQ